MKGVPWKTRDDDDKADGDEMEAIKLDPEEVPADHGNENHFSARGRIHHHHKGRKLKTSRAQKGDQKRWKSWIK